MAQDARRPFAPEVEAELAVKVKRELRKSMQRVRGATPSAARKAASSAIAARLAELGVFAGVRGAALFRPIERKAEVDTTPIDEALRAAGARVAYPFIEEVELPEGHPPFDPSNPPPPPRMGFRWVEVANGAAIDDAFEEQGRGFAEPRADLAIAAPSEIDLVIVPGLAFDPRGHRIGYGAGFYDRYLRELRGLGGADAKGARAVGICFDFQLVAEVPAGPHDVPVTLVVTDKRHLVVE